jgi:hypothetical protein
MSKRYANGDRGQDPKLIHNIIESLFYFWLSGEPEMLFLPNPETGDIVSMGVKKP